MASPVTEFRLRALRTRVGPVALVTMDNGEDWQKPNVFGRGAFASLAPVLAQLEDGSWRGLVLTGKPFVFAAGADLEEFPLVTSRQRAVEASRAGHEAFGRLRALPFPTLAAVNGAALGGGVEIALHCDYRSVSSAVRHFACPEVALGIIPAWGGTQLVPRLVGAQRAAEFIVANPLRQNRMLSGPQAFEAGFADVLLEPVEFLDESLAFLLDRIEEGDGSRPEADLSDAAEVCRKARAQVDDQVHGAAPAPYRALDLIEGTASWTLEDGLRAEEEALGDLLPGPEAQASVYAFNLVERRVKRGVGVPEAAPRTVERVGVVGAGLMATQLATLFLRRLEVPVVITDVDDARVAGALAAIRAELEKQVARGRLTEGKARFLGSIATGGSGLDAYAGCDLVLEAVFEELAVKREVFGGLEAVVDDDCLLVTNTSSLSVTAMSAELRRPGRVVGMHFFNPVAVLPLVELVRTPMTEDTVLATAWQVTGRLGKRGVLVADAPAFVVNRILTRQSSVLMQALEHGNTIEETDAAALKIGLPMPPSALLALVGPRVANHVLHTLHDAYPDRFPLSPALERFADGEMDVVHTADDPRSVDEIHVAILEALADEIRHILDEGVVGAAEDVDTCLVLGAGFPLFRGGITPYLDSSGVSERVVGHRFTARTATPEGAEAAAFR
jgi:3-hydroxyacyl-CoA dehydrogenase/enoyl-CoA hydratase/carnithine racemase